MEQHSTFRIIWPDETPDVEQISAALLKAGAMNPAVTLDDGEDGESVRVDFDYVTSGELSAVDVATAAADNLGAGAHLEDIT